MFSGGYVAAGMTGDAAKKEAYLHIASFFTYQRSTFTDAGKKLQGGYYWSASIVRRVNPFLDIGLGFGESTQGGYARLDSLFSGFQFRDPIFKRIGGKGKDAFHFRYLTVPMSFYLHPLRQRNFYLLMQMWYASLQSTTESIRFYSNSKDPRDNANYQLNRYETYKETYKHDNWGESVGMGYDFSLINHLDISAEIKYTRGFENVIIKSKNNTDSRAFIQSFDAGIGVSFLF